MLELQTLERQNRRSAESGTRPFFLLLTTLSQNSVATMHIRQVIPVEWLFALISAEPDNSCS